MIVRLHYVEIFIVWSFLGIVSSWTYILPNPLPLRRVQSLNDVSSSAIVLKHQRRTELASLSSNHDDSSIVTTQNGCNKVSEMVLDFIACVEASVDSDQFVTFTINGPSKDVFNDAAESRGYLRMIKGRPIILTNKVVIQVTFKYHGATDICKNWSLQDCRKNLEAILLSKTTPAIIPVSEWGTSPPTTFGLPRGIQNAALETSNGTKWELKVHRGSTLLKRHQGSKTNPSTSMQTSNHDRNKYTFVDLSNPVWRALGVTSLSTGTVKPGMSSKLRQCQKFVEIVDKLVADCISTSEERPTSNITVVDMGCGRGYLTFALHSYLHRHYRDLVSSRGIDVRPKLVKEISEIALGQGTEFEGLQFEVGTIESFLAESPLESRENRGIEVVIALHACDTASDDALWSGIYRNSDVIVVAPCCHRELRPQLNQHVSGDENNDHPYIDILRHNIYRERIAETVTDSMRALLLELSGYTVQVFEFIGGEHTSKNVMITAVKNKKLITFRDRTEDELYWKRFERLQSLAKLHGIKKHKLATWIGVALSECESYPPVIESVRSRSHSNKMPPMKR